jgi:hypothetical protein
MLRDNLTHLYIIDDATREGGRRASDLSARCSIACASPNALLSAVSRRLCRRCPDAVLDAMLAAVTV